jgi:hypothetical protein
MPRAGNPAHMPDRSSTSPWSVTRVGHLGNFAERLSRPASLACPLAAPGTPVLDGLVEGDIAFAIRRERTLLGIDHPVQRHATLPRDQPNLCCQHQSLPHALAVTGSRESDCPLSGVS